MHYEIIWFDLDDTLWDFRENSRYSQRRLYEIFNLDRYCPSAEEWVKTYEKFNHRLWERYNTGDITREYLMRERFILPLLEYGCSREEGMKFNKEIHECYLEILGDCKGLIPGARELVEHTRAQGYRTGIISNGFREVQFRKLASSGLDGLFDVVVLSDEIGVNKPDRRIFDYALEKAGVSAAGSLIIGDNPSTDIAGALNAGWGAVYFNRDGESQIPEFEREVKVIESLTELCR